MWGWLYLVTLALATSMTWLFAVRKQSVVFSAALSTVLWSYLALVGEIELVDGGGVTTLTPGPIRWVWAAFALLSTLAIIGVLLGNYPAKNDRTPETTGNRFET